MVIAGLDLGFGKAWLRFGQESLRTKGWEGIGFGVRSEISELFLFPCCWTRSSCQQNDQKQNKLNNEKCNQDGKKNLPHTDVCEAVGREQMIEMKRFTP